VARHRNAAALALDDGPPTELYRPQAPELRTRRAPVPPLWSRLCVYGGALLLIIAIAVFLISR
jgi:hypothetical protein